MASRIPAVLGLVLLSVPSHARDAVVLGSAAARILDARCGACHAPDSENAQARRQVDSLRDLQRFVAETIAPGDPDDSDLWFPIEDNDMPWTMLRLSGCSSLARTTCW